MYKLSKLAAGSVIAASAAIGMAGSALADGYSPRGPKVVYERPADWSGVYFGVSSGYQWSDIDVKIVPAGPTFRTDQDSGLVGAHLGLQHQFGAIVLGIEGGWQSTFRDDWGYGPCPGGGTCGARLNDILTIGGRIGYAAGHWMPYITGGYASARFEHEVRLATGVLDNSMGTRNNGWYIGGGVEWGISPGWSVGVEYRHYEFDSDIDIAYTPAGAPVNLREIDATTDTVSARVSWRWGRPEAVVPLK